MALESATYIDDLNSANPAPTDLIGQGDDHIRLIKAVLQATFPNITGPVTVTQDLLNAVGGPTSGVPFGVITAWYGASGLVPSGWAVCNGSVVAKSDGSGNVTVPDLRDKVILGVGTLQPTVGGAHGAANQTATSSSSGGHSHSTTAGGGGHIHSGVSVAGHALTIAEMPAHSHTVPFSDSGAAGTCIENAAGAAISSVTTSSAGSGAAHSHGMSWPGTPDGTHTHTTDAVAAHTHGVTVPVYQPALALHYIMKV